jgi:hypothetical protein
MKSKAVWQLLVVFILVAVSATFCCSTSRAQRAGSDQSVLRFNAGWWQHVDGDEQQGFIFGYLDCRQPPNPAKASITAYQNSVSGMIEAGKTSDQTIVTKAIEHAWKTLRPQEIDKSAEVYARPHGFLDGEWWGEFSGSWPSNLASMDRGYLEGYLECSSAPVRVQVVHRYQTAINQHYASGRHSHDKVADVLNSLLKRPIGT